MIQIIVNMYIVIQYHLVLRLVVPLDIYQEYPILLIYSNHVYVYQLKYLHFFLIHLIDFALRHQLILIIQNINIVLF